MQRNNDFLSFRKELQINYKKDVGVKNYLYICHDYLGLFGFDSELRWYVSMQSVVNIAL